jgi:hypothetical protein
LVRRRWTGRLQRPLDIAALTPNEHSALGLVNDFVDQLAELPLTAWLVIGRELSTKNSLGVRQAAWTDVERALAEQQLQLAAWYVRDAIDTAACLVCRQASLWPREDRCLFASAHGAAESAALALLARRHIPAESLRALCAPFARQLDREQR